MTHFDSLELRRTLGQFATGVAIVTVRTADGGWAGMTINSFAALSLEPPLITWAVALHSPNCALYETATHFAINVLASDQVELSRRFASAVPDKFAGLDCEPGLGGAPLLRGCIACFQCSTERCLPGGDHTLIVGRVEAIERSAGEPLLFWGGDYRYVAPV